MDTACLTIHLNRTIYYTNYMDDVELARKVIKLRDKLWIKILTPCIKHCKEYNGRDSCKNCGLDLKLIKKMIKYE